ncbi:universal stress protein [Benzoatithermus flavus]|uniref:Universal stress protein n=1 Tax=Benzoatithermus flavus TaxID=3108223 RepID=A0ABU8XUA9_9PROT
MRTILVNLEISPVLDSVLESALLVAKRFGSYIEGLHMRPGQPDIIAAGADGFVAAAPDLVASFEREARERAERARQIFEAFMDRHGLARGTGAPAGGICADWRIESSSGHAAIGSIGRVFDLIVLGRPLQDSVSPSMAALETALFEAGRPLLIAPPQPPRTMGDNVVVAWNCSTETARTVAFAMPILTQAQRITVLTVQRGTVPGPSAAELAHNLQRHGLNVDWREVPPGTRSVGEAILEEAAGLGADLLIKGAYTQSRLRQMIFGGATSHILAEAELPVIMAN